MLVTGADRGIGKSIALAFAKAGASVAAHGLMEANEASRLIAELQAGGSPQAKYFGGNLRDVDQIDALMAQVFAWGRVDILVNNAGIQHTAPIADVTTELWNDILAVNLSAAFHTMRHALPRMAEAQRAMDHLRQLDPRLRLSSIADWLPIHRPENLATLVDGLRRAGLPE